MFAKALLIASVAATSVSAAVAATSYATLLRESWPFLLSWVSSCVLWLTSICTARSQSFCNDAQTLSTTSITVGDKVVELAELACSTPVTKRQTASPIPNVCGEVCRCPACSIVSRRLN